MTPDVYLAVISRDNGCVAVTLGEDPGACRGRLEADHVLNGGMGYRGPSTPGNLVTLCSAHHRMKTEHARTWRPRLVEYLRSVT